MMQPATTSAIPNRNSLIADFADKINVQELVSYFGTGDVANLKVPSEKLTEVLQLAVCLNNSALKQYCEERLIEDLGPQTSLDMFLFAQAHRCDSLQSRSTDMLANNFGILWRDGSFQHLGKNELKRLLELPQINGHPDIKEALRFWMEYEKDFREGNYEELLQFLHDTHGDSGTHTNSRFNPYRKSVRRCRKVPRFAVLFCDGKSRSTLVIDLRNFSTYHLKVKQMQTLRDGFAVCFLAVGDAPYIYVSGGRDSKPCQMMRYDVILNKWKDCKKMSCCRLDHSMVAVGEKIYVIGGHNEKTFLSSIEEYNPQTNSWKTVGNLQQPVRSAACVVFKEKIYIFGGKLFDGRKVATVQCFDPSSKRMRRLPNMPSEASAGKARVVDDQIYYASGQGELYRFDPELECCYPCSRPLIKLRKFAMFSHSDFLFMACGVQEKSGAVDCLLKYKPKLDEWVYVDRLQVPLSVQANCIVEFPNSFSLVPFKD